MLEKMKRVSGLAEGITGLEEKFLQQGKYVLEQELGRGGFGITYKATNTALHQSVVVKTLNETLRQDPNFLNHHQQFQAEASRLARCFHPNVVWVSDFFIEDELPYIVMGYIPGQTLSQIVLPNHPLPEATALHYIQQVGEAVSVVHQAGLLHRDIKPQNLMLRQGTQQVILIDFGIAREFTPGVTQTHTHLVSEGYAPLEQYFPQAKRSPATDIYGLAATLYTLLTAQVPTAAPLRDRSPLAAPRQIRSEISARVSEAVMRGMAIEAQHRPGSVQQWLSLLADTPNPDLAMAGAGSTSQVAVATTVVAGRVPLGTNHAQTKAETVAAIATPQRTIHRSKRRFALIGIAAIVPLVLGYSL